MLRVAVAQINCVVGDIAGNARRLRDWALDARDRGADLVLTPELALCGYPPEDLLKRADFYRRCDEALQMLAADLQGVAMLLGHPFRHGHEHYNAASLLRAGKVERSYFKRRLPNHEVFDEMRYFSPGEDECVFEHKGVLVGVAICADIWQHGPAEAAADAGAELLLVLNASPYHMDKQEERYEILRERIDGRGVAAVYCNLIGAQDELIFDGASFALNADGVLAWQAPAFIEGLEVLEFNQGRFAQAPNAAPRCMEAEVYEALKLGVRDYCNKNDFPSIVMALSGEPCAALSLSIAADALGADKVRAIVMQSGATTQAELADARALANALGVRLTEMQTDAAMRAVQTILEPVSGHPPAGSIERDRWQRIHALLLTSLANETGSLLLSDVSKTELALGVTYPGGMLGVLQDVFVSFAHRLLRYRQSLGGIFPPGILMLADDERSLQCELQALPSCKVVDAIIEAYVERNESVQQIIATGMAAEDVSRVVAMIRHAEYQRQQAPPGIRVSRRGFGKDWRYPLTNRYSDEY